MKRKLVLWFMKTRAYKWLMKSVIWRIRFSYWYAGIAGFEFLQAYAKLEPGDIILASDYRKLTSYLITGPWTHAALCVGHSLLGVGPGFEVAEMTHSDFTRSMFFDVCKEADRIAVLRVKTWGPDYRDIVIEKCLEMKDAKYDIDFQFGIEALYCSELVYQSDMLRRCRVDLSDFAGIGQKYVSPLAYWESPDVEVIYDSAPH